MFNSRNVINVIQDEVTESGVRIIRTEYSEVFNGSYNSSAVGLRCFIFGSDTTFAISMMLRFPSNVPSIDAGNVMLLKLSNKSVFTLKNSSSVSQMDAVLGVKSYHDVFLSYDISETDLIRLMDVGVKRIRIETNSGLIDYNISRNKMSKSLEEAYDAVWDAIELSSDNTFQP